jgi:hypothetical protein
VLSAVDTTSVSIAAIIDPIAVSTTTHPVIAFGLICAGRSLIVPSTVGIGGSVRRRFQ